MFLGTPSNHLL